jgi:hypothetical protein
MAMKTLLGRKAGFDDLAIAHDLARHIDQVFHDVAES